MRRESVAAASCTAGTMPAVPRLIGVGGESDRDRGGGPSEVVDHDGADRREAARHLAVFAGPTVLAHDREHALQAPVAPLLVGSIGRLPPGEGGPIGIERAQLRRRKLGEHRAPRRREVGGKAHAHIGDERRTPGGALLDEVEHVAPVQHREVPALAEAVDECGDERTAEPGKRLLSAESARELERGDTEAVAALLGQVHDESPLLHHREQVVHGRAREVEGVRDRRGGHRPALRREVREDRERLVGRRHLRSGRGVERARIVVRRRRYRHGVHFR